MVTVEDKQALVASAVELCRLLPSPDDQVTFLRNAADLRQATDSNLAYELAAEAQKRMRRWRAIDLALVSPEVEASLMKLMDVIKPIIDIFEPAELVRRFQAMQEDPSKIAALTPVEKATLFARGIPRQSLNIRSDSPDAMPREIAELIAGRVTGLPALPALLTRATAVFGSPEMQTGFAEQPNASATELMSVLFARTLGLDGSDLRPGSDLDKPEYWQIKAESFGQRHLWRWETIARVLQAATSIDAGARAASAQSGADAWVKVQEVHNAFAQGPDAWPAISDWIARLRAGSADALDARDKLPLSPDFRSRGRIRRINLEAQFLAAQQANNKEDAFRLIQQAKAAELTLVGSAFNEGAVDILQLQKVIGFRGQPRPGDVHLFIELFQTGNAGTGRGAVHAFIVRSPTATPVTTTEFEQPLLLTRESTTAGLTELLTESVGPLTDSSNLHILFALSGVPRGVDWSAAEQVLLNRVKGPSGWLVYLPSAGVFAMNSPWTLAPSVRAWYQSLDSAGRAAGMSFANTSCEIPNFGQPDVNNNLRHGLAKIMQKGASRAFSEIACGDGWDKRSAQILKDRRGAVLDFPFLIADDRKR
ncbi:MAG: hypothetical protein IPK83_16080 [Planctomycetes bacterium]|nr:hypothetical protein [Planctomycetota bacterium]